MKDVYSPWQELAKLGNSTALSSTKTSSIQAKNELASKIRCRFCDDRCSNLMIPSPLIGPRSPSSSSLYSHDAAFLEKARRPNLADQLCLPFGRLASERNGSFWMCLASKFVVRDSIGCSEDVEAIGGLAMADTWFSGA